MTSAFRPFFLKKPFWSATQIGVLDGLVPAQAMRIRSWAPIGFANKMQRTIGIDMRNRNLIYLGCLTER
jgi:hypothetical protein